MSSAFPTLAAQASALAEGRTTARALAEAALDAIAAEQAAGVPAFIKVDADSVLREADASDTRRRAGQAYSAWDGVPFGVKDLFDVAGEVTTAGSAVLAHEPPAARDADAVAALEDHGMIVLGRTNMTEFAYSGVGLNPHYGTPPSVFDRAAKRIPGGSSSGSAVAVADGVCAVALGTDTGGSCRIPAAFNGIVGFKPSASRVSTRGAYPLSGLLDSVGPLGRSVACCATVDAMLAGARLREAGDGRLVGLPLRGLRLAVISDYVMEGLEPAVAADFSRAVTALSAAGATISEVGFAELAAVPGLLRNGGIVGFEAFRSHRALLDTQEAAYDPRVSSRIRLGADTDDAAFAALLAARAVLKAAFGKLLAGHDAVICPTVPMVPPPIAALAEEGEYRRLNGLALRNTYVFNLLDGCAGSLPMQQPGAAPTGLMVAGGHGQDRKVLAIMASVEGALAGSA